MRKLYASTLRHFVLGLCFVIPVSANAAFNCNSTTGPASRVLAAQCAQCHGSGGDDLGSYSSLINMRNSTQSGEGPEVMHWQLKGYSDNQLCSIAQFFSTSGAGSGN